MVRELAITMYLFVFRTLFNMFSLFPQKKKTVFVASFGDNILFTLKELEKQVDDQVIILKTSQCKVDFGQASISKELTFKLSHLFKWIQSIYHLATADKVFVDNYYGFLAVTDFKPNVQCIQLWHAAGAIKQFGLKDPSIKDRTPRAYERFLQVYQRFTHVVVGSEKMATIFRESFGLSNEAISRTGIPRSDFFYDTTKMREVGRELKASFPVINRKKVILYAPTYRDDQLNEAKIALDIQKLEDKFSDQYVLFLKLHPAIKREFYNAHSNFVYDVSDMADLNELLVITDILITDYSSIPFEFSLLERPMIFFAYDKEEYANTVGFWEDYETLVPGSVVGTTEEIIEIIDKENFDPTQVREFAKQWNQYSRGNSSKNLVKALYTEEKEYQQVDVN
ncbi:CDP-glycerol glycerophosphotransferase family protein [Virgibacillus necropolis]|uniref:CDP-glycerol--glycerophosphate glycerophosphotransferase n=1 Tax=Virgibacillus necropolis TaxID=163877 RepID=A0A221M902_9BACI|nr:CDP-glycerol glycerophosphotransferase family protein [Virgibacillus necropolis]ASN04117.1 CDP-glycerol--glycerophosphate glycerophosphotransferase [Virgibacillus necropolis]